MINSKEIPVPTDAGTATETLESYHLDMKSFTERAKDRLRNNRKYAKLQKQLCSLSSVYDLVKIGIIKEKMEQMEKNEIRRLIEMEMEQRKSVNHIAEILKEIDVKEFDRYQELMAGMLFCFDMIDSTISDINKVLKRNKIGIDLNKFEEFNGVRRVIWDMVSSEQKKMPNYKNELWSDESEHLYEILQNRCGVYRRKVNRVEEKIIKEKGGTK